MKALLDTHCFLWAVISPEKLSARQRKAITDSSNDIYLSTISFWEIALKFSLGKLDLTGCTPDDLVSLAAQMGLSIVTPTAEESAGFHHLPREQHKDPFDRMLVWQCLQHDWTLITHDSTLSVYRSAGLKILS
jgi:PIN domain nuclease of toxin-antitoxin system